MEQIVCPLFERAEDSPDKTALVTDSKNWTYRELNEHVSKIASALKVKPQEKVAFIASLHPATLILLLALWRLRAIACPLRANTPTKQLQSLDPTHYIDPEHLPWQDKLKASMVPYLDLDALSTFLFTSGSTSTPKIACHTLANHYYSAKGILPSLQLDTSSSYQLCLPLFHVSGLAILLRSLLAGSTLVISSLNTYPITHTSFVPTQLHRLCHKPPPPSLRYALLGGAPLPTELYKRASGNHWPVHSSYGMTEMSSTIFLEKVLPFREIKIESGEIYVRGKTLFKGYWDPHKKQLFCPLQDGWFATKDLGYFNKEGDLIIQGRKDRQFISGGENIQPEEIERALCSIPGVQQAYVTAVQDPEFGARPIAYIEDTTHAHTFCSIQEALKPLLPTFKHPIAIRPWQKELF